MTRMRSGRGFVLLNGGLASFYLPAADTDSALRLLAAGGDWRHGRGDFSLAGVCRAILDFLSPRLCRPVFVKLKFITSPLLGYLLWQRGDIPVALAALIWPFVGPMVVGLINLLPLALLSLTPLGKAGQIEPVQTRFLLKLVSANGIAGCRARRVQPEERTGWKTVAAMMALSPALARKDCVGF